MMQRTIRNIFNRPREKPFSIIIPTYCCAEKLERSILSVLKQPQELYELFVVDGGSQDATLDIIQKYQQHLQWLSEGDDGVYDAMNKGIAMSSAPYLYFLGAGDTLREGVLARVENQLPIRAIGFLYGNVLMQDKGVIWDGAWTPKKFRTRTPCQQAIFYDRRIFQRQGLFETRFRTMADYAMNIRCFGDRKIMKVFFDEVICDYEGAGLSATLRDEQFYLERSSMLEKYLKIVDTVR